MISKTSWLSYRGAAPRELRRTYDVLQRELNWLLGRTTTREALAKIDLTLHRGDVWRKMRDAFKTRVETWPVRNKAWYSYIVFENLRRILESQREASIAWQVLQDNGMKTDATYWRKAHAAGIYPTAGLVRGLLRHKTTPVLPESARLVLDYTISERQIFTMTPDGQCRIRTSDGEWIDWDIILPAWIDGRATGRVAKPRFTLGADNQLVSLISYEIQPGRRADGDDGILGVDLGIVKPFSASAIHSDGMVSREQVASRHLETMSRKIKRLETEKSRLWAKHETAVSLKVSEPSGRLSCYNSIKSKITRLKHEAAVQASREIVEAALRLGCGEVHVENLAWLDSHGGKWDHSAVQAEIKDRASRAGLRVKTVNPSHSSDEHPVTGEHGRHSGRNVIFKDGSSVDRDRLASVNLAFRSKRSSKIISPSLPKGRSTPRRVKLVKRDYHKIVEEVKGRMNDQDRTVSIVAARPRVPLSSGAWGLLLLRGAASSTLFPPKRQLARAVALVHE
jgi:hypothetical protein